MTIKSILKEQAEIRSAERELFKRDQDWRSRTGLVILSQLLEDKWEVFSGHYSDLKLAYTGKIPAEVSKLFRGQVAEKYILGELDAFLSKGYTVFINYTGDYHGRPHLAKFILSLRNLGVKMSMKTVEKLLLSVMSETKALEKEIEKWREVIDVF